MSDSTRWCFRSALTAAAVLGCAGLSAAQPAVTSVSGTFAHGNTLTISGSSFGTKTTAAPRAWENFDDGVLDGALTAHGAMTYNNADNLRHPFASFNARANFKVSAWQGDGYYFSHDSATAARWFVQYWVKPASNWQWGTGTYSTPNDGLANVKIFRVFPTGSRTYSNVGYSLHGFDGGDILRFVENGAQTYIGVDARPWFAPGIWHNVQVEYGENGGVDQNNGRLKLWVDGVLRDSMTTLNTNTGSDGSAVNKRPYIIGFFDSWPASDAAVSNMYAYYSDIYVDSTWSRVEVGDASTYSASTRREIQIPTAWSATSVTVLANQGAFTSGQAAYLYVVDSNGNVNANGYLLSGGSAPNPPQNLRIVP